VTAGKLPSARCAIRAPGCSLIRPCGKRA